MTANTISEQCVLVFNFTQHTVEADDDLNGVFKARIIPMPSEIAIGCGQALLLEERPAEAYRYLVERKTPIAGVYILTREGLKTKATLVDRRIEETLLKKYAGTPSPSGTSCMSSSDDNRCCQTLQEGPVPLDSQI